MMTTNKTIKTMILFPIMVCLILMGLSLIGCTKQSRVRNFGGTETVTLDAHQKLVNVTWKDNALWFLTRPMTNTDSCETYTFKESSSWGIFEGAIVIKETR